jgi:hypothetical protein
MRYASKKAMLDDIRAEHDALCARLDDIPRSRWREPGVWGDGWTLSDLVAHLAEWQFMFLGWYEAGLKGADVQMPAPGYKWNELPRLNRAVWAKHRSRSRAAVRADFETGYHQILDLAGALSEAQLLQPGHVAWTGKNGLRTYLGANTASHYRFASGVVNRWLRSAAAQKKRRS